MPSEWKPVNLGMSGIRQATLNGEPISTDHAGYLAQLNKLEAGGWRIIQTEWHHSEFRGGKKTARHHSPSSLRDPFPNASTKRRAIVKGQLEVTWTPHKTNSGLRIPGTIKGFRTHRLRTIPEARVR
ncbi:MAG: hypothetical protein CM1200mP29_13300 [Verrucomicrobiota bacterium]|nr:MAG: hypothetical protein CM1200mP29_13300 [Verrucomicrobiota bacterium]